MRGKGESTTARRGINTIRKPHEDDGYDEGSMGDLRAAAVSQLRGRPPLPQPIAPRPSNTRAREFWTWAVQPGEGQRRPQDRQR
jgi:hypothetical protein